MITYKTGDILTEAADALVNTVNCVGVMGRGVALQFKRAFPENFKAYAAQCKRDEMRPGRVFVFETGAMVPPRYIINFPTKRHWRGKSRLEGLPQNLWAEWRIGSPSSDPQRARVLAAVKARGSAPAARGDGLDAGSAHAGPGSCGSPERGVGGLRPVRGAPG